MYWNNAKIIEHNARINCNDGKNIIHYGIMCCNNAKMIIHSGIMNVIFVITFKHDAQCFLISYLFKTIYSIIDKKIEYNLVKMQNLTEIE